MDTKETALNSAPMLVRRAVGAVRHKIAVLAAQPCGPFSEAGKEIPWAWDRATAQERQSVDDWLCQIKHPLAFESGTAEQRFRAIVKELV